MRDDTIAIGLPGVIRRLDRQEMPLLREHLLRLDTESRHDRFNGFADESFIDRYAAKCATDGTIVIAYLEGGEVLAAAELHPADGDNSPLPEVAFSVERKVRRKGLGSVLFRRLIAEGKRKGYDSLRITTGAQNEAMRSLANKFGAHLTFRHGESTGEIDLRKQPATAPTRFNPVDAFAAPAAFAQAVARFNRDYWTWWLRMSDWRSPVPRAGR
ncbi:N-acetyltransferase family protein [Nitrobacteraceae bacterium UC4446_H13]